MNTPEPPSHPPAEPASDPLPEPPHGDPPEDPAAAPSLAEAKAVAGGHTQTILPSRAPSRSATLWVVVAAALALGAWGLWKTLAPATDNAGARLREQASRIEALQQQVATLSRSDQISRDANRDVQGTLAERDEEVAALRADVAFYERFVGATGQRRGLTVHELQLQPQSDTAWHFTATLTQNLNRGAVSSGRALLSVEGMQAGKLRRLAWSDLRQQADAPGVAYSFKYFEQVEGDIALPPGFAPLRVVVRLVPQGAAAVEQSFAWAEAAQVPSPGA